MTDQHCPICGHDYAAAKTATFGASVTHDEGDQARTCFEPIADGDTARVRLYFHRAGQLVDDDREGHIETNYDE